MTIHCGDIKGDRKLGAFWEQQFSKMAGKYGYSRIEQQTNRDGAAVFLGPDGHYHVLPDVTLVKESRTEYHEVKHKNGTKFGTYGLEVYRFEALLLWARQTGEDVQYTIHDHDLAGGRDAKENDVAHWVTANVLDLEGPQSFEGHGWSYVDGEKRYVPMYYWPMTLWRPLEDYWSDIE